jgi:hypothetical protein
MLEVKATERGQLSKIIISSLIRRNKNKERQNSGEKVNTAVSSL